MKARRRRQSRQDVVHGDLADDLPVQDDGDIITGPELLARRIAVRPRVRMDLDLAVDQVHDPIKRKLGSTVVVLFYAAVLHERRIGNLDQKRDVFRTWMVARVKHPASDAGTTRSSTQIGPSELDLCSRCVASKLEPMPHS